MFDRYVGLPWIDKGRAFDGVDCWGLIYLANKIERSIELPSYSDRYVTAADDEAIGELIAGEVDRWEEIAPGRELTWDCVLMRHGRVARHIGLVVSPGRVLHVDDGMPSLIENYRGGLLRHRVVGFHRYRCNG